MKYRIYSPSGNDTALVLGDGYANYKALNDEIMRKHPHVEQVGFLNQAQPKLTMAGGEFCGNAVRCAAFYYLHGQPGRIEIETCAGGISCGIDENREVWLALAKPAWREITQGIYFVELDGIRHIVVTAENEQALGVMFYKDNTLKPIVYVPAVDTCVNETACLSGTVAVASVLGRDVVIGQPSGKALSCQVGERIIVRGEVREIEF
ncbi:MAG: hypothetical protein LBT32_02010 [Peptococcaceae bacterium]|jgi:diaminopimelate epimerase|nr:hypothetical protein [Peptococcaceae bacterium]